MGGNVSGCRSGECIGPGICVQARVVASYYPCPFLCGGDRAYSPVGGVYANPGRTVGRLCRVAAYRGFLGETVGELSLIVLKNKQIFFYFCIRDVGDKT